MAVDALRLDDFFDILAARTPTQEEAEKLLQLVDNARKRRPRDPKLWRLSLLAEALVVLSNARRSRLNQVSVLPDDQS